MLICKSSSMPTSPHHLHDPALDLLSKGPVKTFMASEKFVRLEAPNATPSHGLSPRHARRSSSPMVSAAMDDFVLRVYLPQLQEKVMEVFFSTFRQW